MKQEIETAATRHPELVEQVKDLRQHMEEPGNADNPQILEEKFWKVFFPEATGIRGNEDAAIGALRAKREVSVEELNPTPINDPAREILFTTNVLLTLPKTGTHLEELGLTASATGAVRQAAEEPQEYWYDHPIPLGAALSQNEVVYGLQGLDRSLGWEKEHGSLPRSHQATCILSVSTTHSGLNPIAREYVEKELARAGGLNNLQVYVFTEDDVKNLIHRVLTPTAGHFLGRPHAQSALEVIGVDGPYGRHYTFLKAIAAFWSVLQDQGIRATFKFDLDQVFPQDQLQSETGESALQHFTTALWGARGRDHHGHALELGLLCGAVVNETDIAKSLFTPDVTFPEEGPIWDEWVFFSRLPQALSTRAEMMARYDTPGWDDSRNCLQRIHVTGGTTGILVDSLRRHRPFVPSFIGRAEDQALVLSLLNRPAPRLACLHKPGLIMRHDKHSFAEDAIQAAQVGTLLGDYVRILYFSAYVDCLARESRNGNGWDTLKELLDPFTGCFASRLPITVVLLRFGLKAAHLFLSGKEDEGREFLTMGHGRLQAAMDLVGEDGAGLAKIVRRERESWNLYYDILDALENGLDDNDDFALKMKAEARALLASCRLATNV